MTNQYNKKLAGVCGGVAEYLGIDSTIVRLIWLFCAFFEGTGLLVYIICALFMVLNLLTLMNLCDIMYLL